MAQPVKLISNEETLVLSIGESRFLYRRIRAAEKHNIIQKHTVRGQIDQAVAAVEILRLCLKGWEGVQDSEGNEVTFSTELIEALPETVLMQLEIAVISASGETYKKN
ncbi:MAG: hypothetical protein ONB55_21745 [candidate division KSB1 bacterium]|nr:hypothetical protein [candidate division KSB1 bacterium]